VNEAGNWGGLSLIAAGLHRRSPQLRTRCGKVDQTPSASGNQLSDAGSTQLVWRGVVVKTLVEARMFSDTEAIILASAILGVALLALM
jgi:hypothetical protein